MRLVFCSFLFVNVALANAPLPLPRLNSPIKLDGIIDEPAWEIIAPLPLVMYQPTYKGAMSERTEIRVAYDDEAIYMSGKLLHRNVKDMRGNSFYRDRWSGDDTFALVLDTFNDNENAVWFYTTPLGTRFDTAVANDAAAGRRDQNPNWNTAWEAKTTRHDSGWCAELRIPFASLSFQNENGRVIMGLIAYRWMAYNNERYIFPDIPPKWERGSNKPSLAQDVVLEGVFRRKPVFIAPYVLGGTEYTSRLNREASAYELAHEHSRELGVDMKYNVTNNLTLDATLNTDFAQVEADEQQINLTRFSLFFPEKRQFFQERASTFEFGFEGSNRLFHSRRIGLDSNGQPLRIHGGARLVGRINTWDLGLLNLQTASNNAAPSENFGVLRARRQIVNDNSNLGAIVTTKIDAHGERNLTYGLDGLLRPFGQEYVTLKWAQSLAENRSRAHLRNSRIYFDWLRRKIHGLSYNLTYSRAGADYSPAMGFESRRDFSYVWNSIDYQIFTGERSKFRRHWFGHWGNVYTRNRDGSVESVWLHPFYYFETKAGAAVAISTEHSYEDVRQSFFLSQRDSVFVRAGRYWFHNGWLLFEAPDGWYFRPDLTFRHGSFYDGHKTSALLTSDWNLSKHLILGGNYEVNVIRFAARNQCFTSHLGRVRVQSALNNRLSFNAFVQYNSAAELIGVNVRLRYNFREGHDLWLVYNLGLNAELEPRTITTPRLPRTDSRALLLKYTNTLLW